MAKLTKKKLEAIEARLRRRLPIIKSLAGAGRDGLTPRGWLQDTNELIAFARKHLNAK